MTERRPLVIISGSFSELPLGDTTPVDAGILTAGSGIQGGGALDGTDRRFDIELAAAPSGLILVGTGNSATLGLDGAAQVTANTALASGNFALIDAGVALASGNSALIDAGVALASGNAALVDLSGKVNKSWRCY